MMDEIERDKRPFEQAAIPIVQKYLVASKPIRFSGDNYSAQWELEAEQRGLPNVKESLHAFEAWLDPKTTKLFENVLTETELKSRYEVLVERYSKRVNIEVNLMLEIWRTQLRPAAIKFLALIQEAKAPSCNELHSQIDRLIDQANEAALKLEAAQVEARALANHEQGAAFCDKVRPLMAKLREPVDRLETLVDDDLWPLPKYRELLFSV